MFKFFRPFKGPAAEEPCGGSCSGPCGCPKGPRGEKGPSGDEDPVGSMCAILTDPEVDDDDKFMALTTLAEALFPDKPIFRDITDASDWPPPPEVIDAAIVEFRRVANACITDEGAEPFQAAAACIEWALGRPHTGHVPSYFARVFKAAGELS